MKSDLVDIKVRLHHQTERAIRVSDTGEDKDGVWLPLSQIEINKTDDSGIIEVTMPVWLAKDKGLI